MTRHAPRSQQMKKAYRGTILALVLFSVAASGDGTTPPKPQPPVAIGRQVMFREPAEFLPDPGRRFAGNRVDLPLFPYRETRIEWRRGSRRLARLVRTPAPSGAAGRGRQRFRARSGRVAGAHACGAGADGADRTRREGRLLRRRHPWARSRRTDVGTKTKRGCRSMVPSGRQAAVRRILRAAPWVANFHWSNTHDRTCRAETMPPRSQQMKKAYRGALLALALLSIVAACGDGATSPDSQPPMDIGGQILVRDPAGRKCGINYVAVEVIASDGQSFRAVTRYWSETHYDGNGYWRFYNVPQGRATLLATDTGDDFLPVERTFNVAPLDGSPPPWRETLMNTEPNITDDWECPVPGRMPAKGEAAK